jgi:5-methyltetrahydropteroyltriglutamate--homocysteine methyltransferase
LTKPLLPSDPEVKASLAARGDDWSALIDKYIGVIQRGSRRRSQGYAHWYASLPRQSRRPLARRRQLRRGRGPIVQRIGRSNFTSSNTTPRVLAASPRYASYPSTKQSYSGLSPRKSPNSRDKETLKRRLDEATRFVSVDRLAVSPQCGFASVETGNPVTVEAEIRKLELICESAREISGDT